VNRYHRLFNHISLGNNASSFLPKTDYNGLKGTIPTELALLSLRVIDLKWNDLDTTIPTEICSLTNLRSLFLGYNNNVKGKIPTCIGELSKLERFFASNNIITGELPSSLKKLSSLERLIIDDNLLNGDPTDLFVDMKNLSMLMLNSNSFTGTINSEFLSEHPLLSILDISNNNFTVAPGSDLALPRHLMKLKELRILDFSYNKLTGSLPESFFDEPNTVLNMFNLYGNKITGSIPASIGNCSNLTHFDISDNLITGIIPTTIYALQNLTTLFISNNPTMEEAPIPVELSSMKKLKEISMRNSSRSGELFHHLGGLQKLVLLDLSSNPSLEGTIPEQWGNLTKLEFLLLQNNPGINGSIPSTFTRLENLRAAFIDGTGLTGTVEPICSLERFATVNLTQGEFIYATCLDTTNNATASVSCDCCVCCNETSGTKSCSNPSVGNLDASWEFDYKRYIYPFWTNEGYFVSSKENT
jgi:Leucine-rich repeat (LRR) protein